MTILSIVLTILLFGFLIAIHEFGHFLAAKSLGVRVNEFAIGMGPLLLSRTRGETAYSLRALPIGGFCAMEGEEEDSGDPRSFYAKPAWKKLLILVAGPFMNFAAGFWLILLLFAVAGTPSLPVVTGFMAGAEDLAERIRRKKAEILPDCALCRTPCGRFFDYDTDDLWQARPEIRERKIEILREAGRRSRAGTGETDTELLCRALFAVGEFCGAEWLDEILGGLA